MTPLRLAIVTTHPIQYYAPWFRFIASQGIIDLVVYYLWNFGISQQTDRVFQQSFQWDIPLLDGYMSEFIPNVSSDPGTHHFGGIDNPSLNERLLHDLPDAVLCIGYNYRTFSRLLRSPIGKRVPLILRGDSHRLIRRTGVKEWLKRAYLAKLFQRFSAFLHVGRANREYYSLHGVPEQKLFFSPHCVDNERFIQTADKGIQEAIAWKRDLQIPDDHRVILFAGKFEDKKRPLDLLAAFRRANLEKTTLLFVGNGPLTEQLRANSSDNRHVRFAPFQNQQAMPRTYCAGDLVVLPSFGASETWGLCINEAMCMKRPVLVSTHVGCAADLIEHQRTGLLFEAGNVQALTEQIINAFANDDRRKIWAAAGLERVQQYSYENATRGLWNCLQAIVPPKD